MYLVLYMSLVFWIYCSWYYRAICTVHSIMYVLGFIDVLGIVELLGTIDVLLL